MLMIHPTGGYHETILFLSESGHNCFLGTYTFLIVLIKITLMLKCVPDVDINRMVENKFISHWVNDKTGQ